MDEEVQEEDDYRGPAPSLDDDLRSELNNLKPTRRAVVEDEEDEDSALSYFAKLASDD